MRQTTNIEELLTHAEWARALPPTRSRTRGWRPFVLRKEAVEERKLVA